LWGAALEVEDKVGAVSAAATMVGIEVLMLKRTAGSISVGLDLVAAGDVNSNKAIHIRRGNASQGQRDWDVGIISEVPAIHMILRQTTSTLPDGLWRIVTDAAHLRVDRNTATAGDFSTFDIPMLIAPDQTVVFLADDAAGTASAAQITRTIASGETALLLRRNIGGVFSLARVTMGAPDSGGVGFRVLRVPN
jgi:hypothetical protein